MTTLDTICVVLFFLPIEESDSVESETIGFVPSLELPEEEKESIRGGN